MLSSLTLYIMSLSNTVETASSNSGVALQRASRDVCLAAASLGFLFRSLTNILTPLTDFVDRIPSALPIWLGPAPSYTKEMPRKPIDQLHQNLKSSIQRYLNSPSYVSNRFESKEPHIHQGVFLSMAEIAGNHYVQDCHKHNEPSCF